MESVATNARRPIRSIRQGFREMHERNEVVTAYAYVFLGNFLGWLGKLLYSYKITGESPFGPLGSWELLLQLFFSAVVAAVITTGIWPKLKGLEPTYRYFVAFSAGATTNIGIDLLVSAGSVVQRVM